MKNKITFILFFLSMAIVLGAQTQKVLIPTEDTYIYKSEIRGMEPVLCTYHSTAGTQYRRQSFLKFDISALSPNIETVTFRIYGEAMHPNTNLKLHTFRLTPVEKTNWAEDDISFEDYLVKFGTMNDQVLAELKVADGTPAQYHEFSSTSLTQMVKDSIQSGAQFIALRLREATVLKDASTSAAVVCEFHSKENASQNVPQLIVEEQDVTPMHLAWLKLNAQPVEDFTPTTYRYVVNLPWDAVTAPIVSAQAVQENASIEITQATVLNGSLNERTARVTVANGNKTLTYSVVFQLLPPPTETRLAAVLVDGEELEFFTNERSEQLINLPYSAVQIPRVEARTLDPYASYSVQQATSLNGTAIIRVRSANQAETREYRIVFNQLPELDIILAIGQSNMAGRASCVDYNEPMNDIYLLTPQANMEVSSNPMNKYSNIRKDIGVQGLGPSYQCAVDLQKYLKRPVGFVVNAQGGSSITLWYQKGKKNFDSSLERALAAQKYGRIRAIIWHQGSADNSAGLTDDFVSYKQHLAMMVKNFRDALNEPDLFFICGELSARTEFNQFSQTVIHPVATYIPNSDYIVAQGTALLSDGIHFDVASNILMGQRYAQKVIEHVYTPTTALNKLPASSVMKIWRENDKLLLKASEDKVNVAIHALSGKPVFKALLHKGQQTEITLPNGFYLMTSGLLSGLQTDKFMF